MARRSAESRREVAVTEEPLERRVELAAGAAIAYEDGTELDASRAHVRAGLEKEAKILHGHEPRDTDDQRRRGGRAVRPESRGVDPGRDNAYVRGGDAEALNDASRVRLRNGDDRGRSRGATSEVCGRPAVDVVTMRGERERNAKLSGELARRRGRVRREVRVHNLR